MSNLNYYFCGKDRKGFTTMVDLSKYLKPLPIYNRQPVEDGNIVSFVTEICIMSEGVAKFLTDKGLGFPENEYRSHWDGSTVTYILKGNK